MQGRVQDLELELCGKDGRLLWVLLNASAILGETGQVVASRCIVVDITERKRFEQSMVAAHAQLDARCETLEAKLADTGKVSRGSDA